MSHRIFVFCNRKNTSIAAYESLKEILSKRGHIVLNEYSEDATLLICIGGDGTFLSFVHKCNFPSVPILGINTGHLGFFQESSARNLEKTIEDIENGNYTIQNIKPVSAKIFARDRDFTRIGVNEIVVRGTYSHSSHFSVFIDETKIQDFSGDGILVATAVGSTAYNYSLGGSLVSPDLNVLQLTPIAPMNTNAYRCFKSSILLPATDVVTIRGNGRSTGGAILLSFDGRTHEFNNVSHIEIRQDESEIHLIRQTSYDYWNMLSSKLL
ncbi:MAG: NAD(+)/NADH kinase [Mogibacterium sp.]|nr:NAD(+)/NADH kinase [Mogibacterium sp.]